MTNGSVTGYTRTAVVLHWTTALLIFSALALGMYMVGLAFSPAKLRLFSYHKWIGVTVFLFALARLVWRYFHKAPELPGSMPAWEKSAAKASHSLLYALMFIVPVSGWLMSSAHGFQTVYLGIIPLPDLVEKNKELEESLELAHFILNKTLLAFVLLHIAAALKHHFIDRDEVLKRMLRFGTVCVVAVASLVSASAQAAPVLKDGSRIEFVSKQMGVPIKGSFKNFDADVLFDPANLKAGRTAISIDLESIDAGSDEATVEIKRRPWFDVKNYPRAEFTSSTVTAVGPGLYRVTGKMTIKGRTREVSAPFAAQKANDRWTFDGKFTLKRLDFNIGEGAWADTGTVADEVEILFRFAVPVPKK